MTQETLAASPAAATAEAKPATPAIDAILEAYHADEDEQRTTRTNVFAECIKGGAVTVHTEAQASEMARLMTSAEAELERVKAVATAQVARAQARLSNLVFLFFTPLEVWASARLAGGKKRSLLLEGGKLAFRKIPGGTRYVDKDATLEWAQASYPAAVKMVPTVDTGKVNEWEAENKAAAPGRELTPDRDSFSVSTPKA